MVTPLLTQRWFWEVAGLVALLLAFTYQLDRAKTAERALVRTQADAEIAQIQGRMSERDASIKHLVGEVTTRESIVRAQQLQIDHLMSVRPSQSEVTQRVNAETATDPALVDAAQRIAGVRARVASACK